MSQQEFFPPRPESHPIIYAYEDTNPIYGGLLKVGYTERTVEERMREHCPTLRPGEAEPYVVRLVESAMRSDGSCFTDHDVHRVLEKKGFAALRSGDHKKTEFFRCTVEDVKAAILAVRTGTENFENRTQTFPMRPEQERAVEQTMAYFASAKRGAPERSPKFLWNAKMRFGKTFASYQLAKRMGFKKVLVLTFKPAVQSAWEEDLMSHVDFEGWQFVSRGGLTYEQADHDRPIVCFGSFQDYLGTNENGGIKAKNEWVHTTNWDLVIFDEYHFGAWRENARKLFEMEDEEESLDFDAEKYKESEADNAYNETFLPITTGYYLFLSGTPFRALNSGEFIEEQIFSWTYSDEQREKEKWGDRPDNPYAALPRMVMMTYRIPDSIRRIAMQGETNEFDLNVFFSAKGRGAEAKFVYEDYVQKWLDLIRGSYLPSSVDDLKLGQRPPMPYSDGRLMGVLSHTIWFLPNVASCQAMYNLLMQRQNTFYQGYTVNVCAGTSAGVGVDALAPAQQSMGDPLKTKTITLSCGKLTTGVTVKPWTGIFMLRNLKSPETYFQAAFRVQSPLEIVTGDGRREIMKRECYVFDFALDRALKQIAAYSCDLNQNEGNPEKNVAEFINFLPVLAYDGAKMTQINAQDVLDIALSGTSATLLAKRWESALLVNVDNETLRRLMASPEAMAALMRIEGFRSLNSDIETIINKSDAVKKAKRDKGDKMSKQEKKELSEEEKEYKSMRRQIQEKLIKFATRIPVFMYLTDYRERSLKDVITQLEPALFKKVTGLDVKDFELLVSLNVLNGSLMNDAIYKFKRYEDSSLSYTGIDQHQEDESVGGWDIALRREEYERLFVDQQSAMTAPTPAEDDVPETPVAAVSETAEDEEEAPAPEKAPAPAEQTPVVIPSKPKERAKPRWSLFGKRKEKPKIDTSSIVPGSKLTHKTFGEGTVVAVTADRVTVRFDQGEKSFIIPDALERGFLMV
ncbi:MAG: GIY-YIG nuclease family protein [Oscillospiraceae bacterium]|nr:GIY-YIG nuclease family protein [Oscillospiraceae bacterium]